MDQKFKYFNGFEAVMKMSIQSKNTEFRSMKIMYEKLYKTGNCLKKVMLV